MISSGIITENKTLKINDNEILHFLHNMLDNIPDAKEQFKKFKRIQFFDDEISIIEFFVKCFGYVIIYDNNIYYQADSQIKFDKLEYVKNGFKLNKMPKLVFVNGKFVRYKHPITEEFEKDGFKYSMKEENDLPYWYPKTANIGFKTPSTIIVPFSQDEVNLIKMGSWSTLNEHKILERIKNKAKAENFDLNNEIFVRLGISSNKFNFATCHIKNFDELFLKMLQMFDDMYFKLEWLSKIELVLREFIKTNYQRGAIYNGMPLNTEFRVFYDFDHNKILGIFNYWDKETMLDNLYNQDDLITYANVAEDLEKDYTLLSPSLEKQIIDNLPKASLSGKWSIDFLYDGQNFVLIDMAYAQCSYYYDKVLARQKRYHN